MFKIKGYYLPVWQDEKLQKQNKIRLLITDADQLQKIENVVRHVGGEDAKSPMRRIRGDTLLEVKVSVTTRYFLEKKDATPNDLLGLEVEAQLTARRYSFKSRYETNLGERVTGVSMSAKSLTAH